MLTFAAESFSKAKFVIAVMNEARKNGISVPKIYPTRCGKYLIRIGTRYYFLQDYIEEGREFSYDEAGKDAFFAMGRMAAKLNNVFSGSKWWNLRRKRELAPVDILSAEQEFVSLARELITKITLSASEELALKNMDFILSQFTALREYLPPGIYKGLPTSIIHGDMSVLNIKWAKEGVIGALFDWERCSYNLARLTELKNLVLAAGPFKGRKFIKDNFIAALKGYQLYLRRKITPLELEALPYLLGPGTFLWDLANWFILRRDILDKDVRKYEFLQGLIREFQAVIEYFRSQEWQEEKERILGYSLNERRLIQGLKEMEILDVELFLMHLTLKENYLHKKAQRTLRLDEYLTLVSKALAAALSRPDAQRIAEFLNEFYQEQSDLISPEAKVFITSYLSIFKVNKPIKVAYCVSLWNGQRKYAEVPFGLGWFRRITDMVFKEGMGINPNIITHMVFVNDGDDSCGRRGKTSEVLMRILEHGDYKEIKDRVHILSLSQKDKIDMGSLKHGALACAMRFAVDYLEADIVIYADGDMDPRQAGNLIGGIIEDGKDIAHGSIRIKDSAVFGRNLSRKLGTIAYNWCVRILLFWHKSIRGIKDTQRSFKAFRKEVLEKILPVKIISIDKDGKLTIVFDKEFLYDFSGDTEWLGRARLCGYSTKEVPIIWLDFPLTSTINLWATAIGIFRGVLRQVRTQYLFKKSISKDIETSLQEGKSVFIGYQNQFLQAESDRLALNNATGKVYRILDIKESLLGLIEIEKGKIYFGPNACYTDILKSILSASLSELSERGVNIAISGNFGRFASILGNTIYLDSLFEEVIEESQKIYSPPHYYNHLFRAKVALLFAILMHESKHTPRSRNQLTHFDEELQAGLAELEVYILLGKQFRIDILDFLKREFGGQSKIFVDARYILELANLCDIYENKKAMEYYYVSDGKDVSKRGVFTGKGKGLFVGEVFLGLRGERQIPDELREFYRYLFSKNQEGKITRQELGFAILSISDNLNNKGYNAGLREELKREIASQRWELLMESYREEVEFGTAGIRGKRGMAKDLDGEEIPFLPGPNRINQDVTGRYSLAVANYIVKNNLQERGVVIGFDVRHGSRELTQLAKEILLKKGVKVYYFEQPRPISEIALATLDNGCALYIYITASHNPKSDNGLKIGNEIGAQLFGIQRAAIIKEIALTSMADVEKINSLTLDNARQPVMMINGVIDFDRIFMERVKSHLLAKDMGKTLKVLYDPLFGTGQAVFPQILRELDYNFSVFLPHAGFNGDFPYANLVDEKRRPLSPDPADRRVLAPAISYASREGFDIVIATDPDSDRCGIAFKDNRGNWQVMKANDLWAFLLWMRINFMRELASEGKLSGEYQSLLKEGYVISTWVTSDLIEKIGRAYGLHIRRPPVGFGKIAEDTLDEIILKAWFEGYGVDFQSIGDHYKEGLERLIKSMSINSIQEAIEEIFAISRAKLFGGFEESNGASLGGHTLEKDGLLAAVVMLELFEYTRSKGLSIWDAFIKLWREFGCFVSANEQCSLVGPTAKVDRDRVMTKVADIYQEVKRSARVVIAGKVIKDAHRGIDITGPKFNEPGYKFIFEDGSWIIIRPSGTEPKIRFYGQAEIKSVEFEGRSDEDVASIRELEERKITKFALSVIDEIRDMVFGLREEAKEAEVKKKTFLKPVLIFDIDGT
ncbi:MAG: phosphotransferase, partial [Candidatus Omnitrophica bacterium]|nr:phosphotransferase [Candidatus Omnitrophota bacterium]